MTTQREKRQKIETPVTLPPSLLTSSTFQISDSLPPSPLEAILSPPSSWSSSPFLTVPPPSPDVLSVTPPFASSPMTLIPVTRSSSGKSAMYAEKSKAASSASISAYSVDGAGASRGGVGAVGAVDG